MTRTLRGRHPGRATEKVFVKQSPTHGLGVFARREISKGATVLCWRGRLVAVDDLNTAMVQEDHLLQVAWNRWTYLKPTQVSAHVNHSCQPNCGIRGNTLLIAMRSIKAGEEITFDYSTCVSEPDWEMTCHCKGKECRRTIKPYNLLPASLKNQYREFTSKYIRESKEAL